MLCKSKRVLGVRADSRGSNWRRDAGVHCGCFTGNAGGGWTRARALGGIYALHHDFVIDIGGRDAGYEFTLFVWFIRQKTDTASKWVRFFEEGSIGVASRKRS